MLVLVSCTQALVKPLLGKGANIPKSCECVSFVLVGWFGWYVKRARAAAVNS